VVKVKRIIRTTCKTLFSESCLFRNKCYRVYLPIKVCDYGNDLRMANNKKNVKVVFNDY